MAKTTQSVTVYFYDNFFSWTTYRDQTFCGRTSYLWATFGAKLTRLTTYVKFPGHPKYCIKFRISKKWILSALHAVQTNYLTTKTWVFVTKNDILTLKKLKEASYTLSGKSSKYKWWLNFRKSRKRVFLSCPWNLTKQSNKKIA